MLQKSDVAEVPDALYSMIAELVKRDIIDIPTVVPHVSVTSQIYSKEDNSSLQLAPTQSEILEEHRKRHMRARELAKKSAKPAASLGETDLNENSKVSVCQET